MKLNMTPRATLLASCLALLAIAPNPMRAQESMRGQEKVELPAGEGKALVGVVCAQCHTLKPLFVYSGDDRQWEILVHEMVAFGAQVSPRERDTMMTYLKKSFSSQRHGTGATTIAMPPGKGLQVLQSSCVGCHGMPLIANKRADSAEWRAILRRHTEQERVKLSAEQVQVLLAYLEGNFGIAKQAK